MCAERNELVCEEQLDPGLNSGCQFRVLFPLDLTGRKVRMFETRWKDQIYVHTKCSIPADAPSH